MKTLGAWALAATVLIAPPATAGNIYKYRGANGEILFTDQPHDRVGASYTLLSVRKTWSYHPRHLSAYQRNRYDGIIARAANRFGVEPALVKAVIHAESQFNRYAVSRVGAQGLMQLMPETAQDLDVKDPFNPRANIIGGTRFLADLQKEFPNLDDVLAAYNAGEANVRRYGGIPPFPETQAYVKKVKQLRRIYQVQMDPDNVASR